MPLTYDEKSNLTKLISEAPKEVVTKIVQTVLEQCPQAITEARKKSTMEIELNKFDRPTYVVVHSLLSS